MTSGSLKLISLLLVIAAGGGVAWRAQQGILATSDSPAETTDETEGSDDDAGDETAEFRDDDVPMREKAPSQITLANWEPENETASENDAAEPLSRRAGAPEKFKRKQARSRSLEESTPEKTESEIARDDEKDDLKSAVPRELDDPQTSEENADPFAAETPRVDKRRPSLPTPVPDRLTSAEPEPTADDPFAGADPKASDEQAETKSADSLEAASPIVLAGHEESSDSGEQPTLLDADESQSAEMPEDDPFAGAAPPDIKEENVEDKRDLERSAQEEIDSTEQDPFAAGADSSPAQDPDQLPRLPPKLMDLGAAPESPANSVEKSETQIERKRSSRTMDSTEEEPIRSRHSPRTEESLPQLQPVPNPPRERTPITIEEDERTPLRSESSPREIGIDAQPDSLDGDGTADHDAPRGPQQPRLSIEKIAPKQAVLRQPFIYSVLVKNTGSADAHQVTVEDRIPKGTTLEGTSPRAELIDKRLVWRLGTLKPDEQKKISIKVIPQEPGPIGSVAKVNFVAEVAAEIEVTAPQILLNVSSPSQVRLGDKLHMAFTVRNAGRADAENVTIRNIIPDGLRHPAGADLEYIIGTLAAQESREIKLDLIATKNGKIANRTIITADGGVNLEEDTHVEVIGEQLLLTRTGKTKLFVDRPAVFTSTVANEGTAAAAKVQVAEVVPAGFEFVDASNHGRYDPATRAVTWSVGPIGPGEEIKLSTKLVPKNRGDYHATVTVTGPAGSVANVDAKLNVEGFPAVAVESKSNSRLIAVGEHATVRIQFKNQGTAAAKNLILSADLPQELQLVNGKGPAAWAQEGNVVAFEALEELQPQEVATYELEVEGLSEGDTRIELKISGDHLTRPLHRDETIRVTPNAE